MNSRQISSYILILLTLPFTLISAKPKEPVDYVDMFIGTSNSRWMLGPYAQEPFGMVQLGPDNHQQRFRFQPSACLDDGWPDDHADHSRPGPDKPFG